MRIYNENGIKIVNGRLDPAMTPTWTGLHTFNAGIALPGAPCIAPDDLLQPFTRMFNGPMPISGQAFVLTQAIPAWATHIHVETYNMVTSGNSRILFQIGSAAGILGTTYTGQAFYLVAANPTASVGSAIGATIGFMMDAAASNANKRYGSFDLWNHGANIWQFHGTTTMLDASYAQCFAGGLQQGLTGPLTQLRFVTENGTDTMSGAYNVWYE